MRIVAGQFRGRKLLGPHGRTTRPITDRVKTALFDALGPPGPEGVVLDLFAGTGSLGLEAISRGAGRCCFAERDRSALDRLHRNIRTMGLDDRCEVWPGDVLRTLGGRLGGLGEDVCLAFVDPPYSLLESWTWPTAVDVMFGPIGRRLAEGGTVILRCRRNFSLPDTLGPLCVCQRRDYGTMSLVFLTLPDSGT